MDFKLLYKPHYRNLDRVSWSSRAESIKFKRHSCERRLPRSLLDEQPFASTASHPQQPSRAVVNFAGTEAAYLNVAVRSVRPDLVHYSSRCRLPCSPSKLSLVRRETVLVDQSSGAPHPPETTIVHNPWTQGSPAFDCAAAPSVRSGLWSRWCMSQAVDLSPCPSTILTGQRRRRSADPSGQSRTAVCLRIELQPFLEPFGRHQTSALLECLTERWTRAECFCLGVDGAEADLGILRPPRNQTPTH